MFDLDAKPCLVGFDARFFARGNPLAMMGRLISGFRGVSLYLQTNPCRRLFDDSRLFISKRLNLSDVYDRMNSSID